MTAPYTPRPARLRRLRQEREDEERALAELNREESAAAIARGQRLADTSAEFDEAFRTAGQPRRDPFFQTEEAPTVQPLPRTLDLAAALEGLRRPRAARRSAEETFEDPLLPPSRKGSPVWSLLRDAMPGDVRAQPDATRVAPQPRRAAPLEPTPDVEIEPTTSPLVHAEVARVARTLADQGYDPTAALQYPSVREWARRVPELPEIFRRFPKKADVTPTVPLRDALTAAVREHVQPGVSATPPRGFVGDLADAIVEQVAEKYRAKGAAPGAPSALPRPEREAARAVSQAQIYGEREGKTPEEIQRDIDQDLVDLQADEAKWAWQIGSLLGDFVDPTLLVGGIAAERAAMKGLEVAAARGVPLARRVLRLSNTPAGATLTRRLVARAVHGGVSGGGINVAAQATLAAEEGRLPSVKEAGGAFALGTALGPAFEVLGSLVAAPFRRIEQTRAAAVAANRPELVTKLDDIGNQAAALSGLETRTPQQLAQLRTLSEQLKATEAELGPPPPLAESAAGQPGIPEPLPRDIIARELGRSPRDAGTLLERGESRPPGRRAPSPAAELREYEAAHPEAAIPGRAPVEGLREQLADVQRRRTTYIDARARAIERIRTADDPEAPRRSLGQLDAEIKELNRRERDLRRLIGREEPAPSPSPAPEDALEFAGSARQPGGFVNVGAVTQGLRKFIRRHFTSRGDLPAPAFEAKVATEGAIRSTMRQVAYAQRDFARAARQAFGRQPSPEQLAQLDEVLKGERHITHAPEPLRPVLSRMRSQIDVLSQRLIDEGVIEEPLATTIRENLGTYATRSYRVFDDPAWAKKVPAEVRTKARALLRSEYPDLPEEELEGLFNTLLYRSESGPIAALAGSKLGSKDLSILTRRKDIAPEIRALWGEYHDPRLNYARSMAHMGQLVEQHKFLTTVRERGLGGFLFERPVVRGETSYHTRIAAEGSTTMEPLNGLYTSPEIADAFARAFKRDAPPPWLRAYYVVNGWAKFSKTVLSPVTHVRNLLGNTGFAVANGHWRAWKAGTAIRATIADMAGGEFNQFRDYAQKLTRLGVLDEGVHLGELRAVIQDAAVRSPDDPNMLGPVRLVRRVGQGAQALYRAEDGVWKIYAYENELARYRSALPNVPADELERRVATIVRNTYPTYSLVPSAVQAFRRFPLLGPFVSFPSEVVRTLSNTIRLTLAELRDPALRSIGAQRLAGLFAAALAVPAAARASRELVGITADAANDLREFLPPWSRVSELFFLSRDEHGNPQFIDLGYSDPYAYLRKPLRALLSGEDWQESLADAAGEALRPFFGEELLSGRLLDVARNQTVDGRRVYNPEADRLRQATDATAHVAAVLTPGAVDSFRRILKGVRGEVGPTGRVYEPDVEIGALVSGQRVSTLDLRQALGFKARDFSKQLADANRLFSSVLLRRGTVSDAELRDAYRQADRARFRVTRTLWRQIRAAERLGVPEQEIEAQLEAAGIPRRQILTLRDGIYERYRPSGWTKRLERESPDIEDRVWLWEGWAREERERPLEPQETQRPPVVGAGARP